MSRAERRQATGGRNGREFVAKLADMVAPAKARGREDQRDDDSAQGNMAPGLIEPSGSVMATLIAQPPP